jgi:hypothetical protein
MDLNRARTAAELTERITGMWGSVLIVGALWTQVGPQPIPEVAGFPTTVVALDEVRPDCVAAEQVFPVFGPEPLPSDPIPRGPYAVVERYVTVDDLGDGEPGGVTVFSPEGLSTPRPFLLWILGLNNRAYYHQSLHETLASYGYVTAIPDTRPFCFLSLLYHRKNMLNGRGVFDLALAGELGVTIDPARTAVGGYSSGGTLAAFVAAGRPEIKSLVTWAAAPAPIWYGVNPDRLLPRVRQDVTFILGELDNAAPPAGWPLTMQQKMTRAKSLDVQVIPQAVHLYFQQPSGADAANPPTTITRLQQQAAAISATLQVLDQQIGPVRETPAATTVPAAAPSTTFRAADVVAPARAVRLPLSKRAR